LLTTPINSLALFAGGAFLLLPNLELICGFLFALPQASPPIDAARVGRQIQRIGSLADEFQLGTRSSAATNRFNIGNLSVIAKCINATQSFRWICNRIADLS